MNVVFLDVDGELTYSNYKNKSTANIDPEKVKLLKEICDCTDAKVVISSSWKGTEDFTPSIYYTLIRILKQYGIEVIGDTPYIKEASCDQDLQTKSLEDLNYVKLQHGTGRAAEVDVWLKEHEVDNFVILDDEDWDWSEYGFDDNWIQPTWYGDGGLKQEHVDKAIKILMCQKSKLLKGDM